MLAESSISLLVSLNQSTMIPAKNGVLEGLTERRDAKVDFGRWLFVQDRQEFENLLEAIIQKTINLFLQRRETWNRKSVYL
jgi:hypothetical protein